MLHSSNGVLGKTLSNDCRIMDGILLILFPFSALHFSYSYPGIIHAPARYVCLLVTNPQYPVPFKYVRNSVASLVQIYILDTHILHYLSPARTSAS